MGDHTCPECGREFRSLTDLRIHHREIHGCQLCRWKCVNCNERFQAYRERKYCSDECRSARSSRGTKAQSECVRCGETFEYYPKKTAGKFCSPCYKSDEVDTTTGVNGSDHPRWNGGKRICHCDRCGERFERYPSHIGDNVFCGEPCRRAWLSDEFTGEGHPNWKGGGNEEYGKGWRTVRQRALERDDHSCRVCGKTRDELGRNPDVHHIRPVRSFIESENHTREDAHYIENVISLCISCHRKAEFEKIDAGYLKSLISDS